MAVIAIKTAEVLINFIGVEITALLPFGCVQRR
jgi:hypothetical protein